MTETVFRKLGAEESFALLDDSRSQQASCRLFTGFERELRCTDAVELESLFAQLESAIASGCHAVGMFDYELGAQMQGIAAWPNGSGHARILLFRNCQILASDQVDQWLAINQSGAPSGVAGLVPDVTQKEFDQAISRIQDYIAAGDTYQINYTYRWRFQAYGLPLDLYARLRARQPVPYGALIACPDGSSVLSLSPELFVRHEQGRLTAQPMKGTAPASGDSSIDAERAQALAADEKNRAENLMIVDLLRNDLGKIARLGTVSVPRLFEVSRFSSVLQMTSTVEAECDEVLNLTQIFQALFPCGSITGAPKRRTMQIVRELEAAPRQLYTGAIGWFEPAPAHRRLGDFCMSVPIRTLLLDAPSTTARTLGIRDGQLGVGAGIVYDSVAQDEYAECRLKAGFLLKLAPEFSLIETMRATREHGIPLLELHLARLSNSASYFGIPCDVEAIRTYLEKELALFEVGRVMRVRLLLAPDGNFTLTKAELPKISEIVAVLLAEDVVDQADLFLRHKTTQREQYDAAIRAAEAQGAFDQLFFNQYGELTEGARSSVLLRFGREWFTPPLDCGVLPGVMRQQILADPKWACRERIITREDLFSADEIVLCNALRGVLKAVLRMDPTYKNQDKPA